VEDRPSGVARRGRARDEGGAEEQGGAGRRRRRDREAGAAV